jgi:hypothetical protein
MCKKEYLFVKGLEEKDGFIINKNIEEKAKQLYEKLFLYYLKNLDEKNASNKAKSIIAKQCHLRNMKPWSWI